MLRFIFIFLSALIFLISGCSSEKDHIKIFGHWKAERLQIQSLHIPMGPDFFISTEKITSLDGEISIPISSFSVKEDSVIVNVPLGLGFDFHFVSKDRIYFDAPFFGKIYFYRVNESTPIEKKPSVAPSPSVSSSSLPHDRQVETPQLEKLINLAENKLIQGKLIEVEDTLLTAQNNFGQLPLIDYYFAKLRIRQNNQDAALQHLKTAFQNGFRQFSLLNNNPDFISIKNDPRYVALVAKYQ